MKKGTEFLTELSVSNLNHQSNEFLTELFIVKIIDFKNLSYGKKTLYTLNTIPSKFILDLFEKPCLPNTLPLGKTIKPFSFRKKESIKQKTLFLCKPTK